MMLPETFCCVSCLTVMVDTKGAKYLFHLRISKDYGSNKKVEASSQRKIRSPSDSEITKRKRLCPNQPRSGH